ncbi:MAG: hypothetical protein ACLT38_01550 [Akkermansia sp.]
MFFQQGRWKGKNEGFGKGGQKIFLVVPALSFLKCGSWTDRMFFFSGRMAEAGISAWRFLAGILLTGTYQAFQFLKK